MYHMIDKTLFCSHKSRGERVEVFCFLVLLFLPTAGTVVCSFLKVGTKDCPEFY